MRVFVAIVSSLTNFGAVRPRGDNLRKVVRDLTILAGEGATPRLQGH
jgi:hypothetical protein